MRGLACMEAGRRMAARAAGLSEAERLQLEEHLSGCRECAREAQLLDGLKRVVDDQPSQLDHGARERAIEAALVAGGGVEATAPTQRRLWTALAAAAALGLAFWAASGSQPDAPTRGAEQARAGEAEAAAEGVTKSRTLPADRVLRGELQHGDSVVARDAAAPAGVLLSSKDGAAVALGRARVELDAGTAFRWLPADDAVVLERGRVLCEVTPDAGARKFAVRTQRFAAVVLGTRFEVTEQAVVVHEGRVRVLAADGSVLRDQLRSGERYALAPPPSADRKTAATRSTQKTGKARTTQETHKSRAARARARLAAARVHLGRGEGAEAQHAIDRAMSHSPGRALRAEAGSLRADAHLVTGDRAAAVRAYLRVAERFSSMPAGENALFAAAHVEVRRGGKRGRALLKRYLERYPDGRFVKEARSRLKGLSATPKP